MVVKALKRKSVNTSGVWQVEAVPESPSQEGNKKLKLDKPSKSEKKQTESNSFNPSESKQQQGNDQLTPNQGNQLKQVQNPGWRRKEQQNQQQKRIKQSNIIGVQQETKNELEIQSQAKRNILKWKSGELMQLVVRLEEQCKHLFNRTYSEAVKEVDWSQISFGDHSAGECRNMWHDLFSKSRSIRELVEEAREMLLRKKVVNVSTPYVSANTSQQSEFLNSSTASKDTSGEDGTPLSERSIRRTENSTAENKDDDDDEDDDDDDDDDEEEEEQDDDDDDDDDDGEEDGDEDDDDETQ